MERHGPHYRVRYRYAGRTILAGTYDTADAAHNRIAQLDQLNRAVRQRLTTPPPTLAEWVADWLPAHLAGVATTARYESMLRTHTLPVFDDHRPDAITRNEVRTFVRTLATRLSPVTVRSIVTVLGLVLREAIDEHYLLFDPTARLRLRDGPGEPRPVATPAQVWRIAGRMPNLHARLLVITAAYTGMRFGELAGLSRANIHLDRAVIHVAADTGALHEVAGQRWLGPPKTKAAVRDIRLPPFLVDGLDRLLRAHPYDTVFCTDTGKWLWRTTPAGSPARAWARQRRLLVTAT
ncbi:tyrosine-type recombinase/integrase [Planosporangium sp. 12N6]|uniref:tyrosine-type recombinase/integrase n=1 Tax=Planosporangium spinosum TaxID=3402278 RepID=UPI003CF24FBD